MANKLANPGTYRMLFETGPSRRRLLQAGDKVHPSRTGKLFPAPDQVPEEYRALIVWARARYAHLAEDRPPVGLLRLLAMRGMGRGLWNGHEADEYVENLGRDRD